MRGTRWRAALLLAGAWLACGGEPEQSATPQARVADGPHDVAVIRVRGMGEIRFELLPELAPATVENFVKLAEQGFYDGTTFHRVIPGFMIQGGDPNSRDADPRDDGQGGPGYTIKAEFSDFPHVRGVVSMARSASPDSAGSQFFIMHGDDPTLDGQYTAFGRVIEGMEVVDRITEAEIDTYGRYGPRDRPYPDDVVMEKVWIEPADSAGPQQARR
jgi:peptidyl-prolyl cis-trans isomerase B (cyclophilin B)